MQTVPLGTFEVLSGELVVSDPAYELDMVSAGLQGSVKASNGTWHAEVLTADEGPYQRT
jgi:hypothetical protein